MSLLWFVCFNWIFFVGMILKKICCGFSIIVVGRVWVGFIYGSLVRDLSGMLELVYFLYEVWDFGI